MMFPKKSPMPFRPLLMADDPVDAEGRGAEAVLVTGVNWTTFWPILDVLRLMSSYPSSVPLLVPAMRTTRVKANATTVQTNGRIVVHRNLLRIAFAFVALLAEVLGDGLDVRGGVEASGCRIEPILIDMNDNNDIEKGREDQSRSRRAILKTTRYVI